MDALDADAYRPEADSDDVLLLYGGKLVRYGQMRQASHLRVQAAKGREIIVEWGELVGRALSKRMVLIL